MSIREILLLLIVAALCCAALVKPRLGLYGYVWFSLLRPDELAWVEGAYPLSMALALSTLVGSVRYAPRVMVLMRNPIPRWLLLLQIPIGLSVVYCVGRFLSPDRYSEFSRMILIVLLIPILLETKEHVRTMILVMAFSLGALVIKFGLYGILQGGVQFVEGLGKQYDNNTLGLAAAMAAPLCWRSASLVSSKLWKTVLMFMVFCASATTVMSNSRAASLSLAAGFLWLLLNGRRKVTGLALICLAAIPPVYLVRETYFSRMSTLKNYKEEGSAASRIEYAGAAIRTWADYPLVGVGFGARNYTNLSAKYLGHDDIHGAHNTYLQILADSGCFAYLIYTGLLFGTILWLWRHWKKARDPNQPSSLIASAIAGPLVAFTVGGTFGSCERYDFVYMLLACAGALYSAIQDDDEGEVESETPEFDDSHEVVAGA